MSDSTHYRMTTEFKKGYPHGPAELLNLENETIWSGDFWNGVVISSDSDQEVEEDVRSRLMFGVTVCLDSRVSCCRHCLNEIMRVLLFLAFRRVHPSRAGQVNTMSRHQTSDIRSLFTTFNEQPFRTNNIAMSNKI